MSEHEQNILYGGPDPTLDIDVKSLGEYILKKIAKNEEKVMFIDGITDKKLTTSDVKVKTIQLAKALALIYNVKEGDVIAVSCENRLEYPIITFAVLCLGATVAPLNITYTNREFQHAINLSRPKLIFASKIVLNTVLKVSKQNTFVQKVILLDSVQDNRIVNNKLVITLSDLVSSVNIKECNNFDCKPVDVNENVALVLCSSGTTGLPKGVELTQHNILIAIGQINDTTAMARSFLGQFSTLLVIPCFHSYGLLTMLGTSMCGAEIVFLPKFEEHAFLRALQTHKCNIAFLVPPLLVFLAKSPLVDKYDISSLMIIGSGAAPLSKEVEDAVRQRLNIFAIRQGYGMSETTLGVLIQTPETETPGSVGTLRGGVWGKVIDMKTGKPLGPNQRGEMCFKGSSIMKGYINNKKATRDTIDKDGWLHTGDVGYYNESKEWFIVDRIKELIKYKGYQVPPAEIEAILLTHPDVLDAAVIGIQDEMAGELPFAFVVRKPDSHLQQQDIIDYVAKRSSPAKRLHGGVQFIDAIPKNVTGKILRRVLRDYITKKPVSKL